MIIYLKSDLNKNLIRAFVAFSYFLFCGCSSLSGTGRIPAELAGKLNSPQPVLVRITVRPELTNQHKSMVKEILQRIFDAADKKMVASEESPHSVVFAVDISGIPLGASYRTVGTNSQEMGGLHYSGAQINGLLSITSGTDALPLTSCLNSSHLPPEQFIGAYKNASDAPYYLALNGGFKARLYDIFSLIYGQSILIKLYRIDHSTKDTVAVGFLEQIILSHRLPLFLDSINSQDDYLKLCAIDALAYMVNFSKIPKVKKIIIDSKELATLLKKTLTDQNSEIRTASRYILREAQVQLPLEMIKEDVNDSDGMVRREAVESLEFYSDDQVLALLFSALNDTDPVVRWIAASQLGNRKNPEAVPYLIDMLSRDTDPVAVSRAIKALGRIGDSRATQPIITVMKARAGRGGGGIRHTDCADALADIGDRVSIAAIISLFDQGLGNVDAYNLFPSLGKFGGYQVIDFLINLHPKIPPADVTKFSIEEVLTNLTGQEFDGNSQKWKEWWDKNKSIFPVKN